MEEKIIGIDLGTTNSLAATVFDEDGPEVICVKGKSPVTPSVLTQTEQGWLVGEEAQSFRLSNPENTVYSVKRLMGRDITEVEKEIKNLPYQVVEAQRQLVKVRVNGKDYTPQELSAEILKKVKAEAEEALGHEVAKAIITVPAYFDDAQRQATRDAAKIAGLEAVRIINEPTAAAIAYGLDEKKDGHVAVYDFGGGTFDVSVLKLSGKVFKVIATHGDTRLGGDDLDHVIAERLKEEISANSPSVDLNDSYSQQLLKQTAESIKINLGKSHETEYHISLPEKSIEHQGIFKVEDFNTLILPLIQETLKSCQQVLADSDLTVDQIDEVVLVGGSTVVPYVRKQVAEFFGREPHVAIDPYKVVAIGAGIQGHLLAGGRRDFLLLDVIPLSLGIETLGGTFSKLITQNTTVPTEASEMFTTHVEGQTAIDINIYQGERELINECRCLGQFKLRGVPPMPAGLPLVEVSFRVDANGILTVSAKEKRSGTETAIEVIPFHGLTQSEIEDIMEDSFEHAIEDFTQRQLIEFRQTLDRVFGGIEQNWEIAENSLSPEEQAAIRKQMEVAKEVAKGNDPQALKVQMDALGELTRPLADTAMGQAILKELQESK